PQRRLCKRNEYFFAGLPFSPQTIDNLLRKGVKFIKGKIFLEEKRREGEAEKVEKGEVVLREGVLEKIWKAFRREFEQRNVSKQELKRLILSAKEVKDRYFFISKKGKVVEGVARYVGEGNYKVNGTLAKKIRFFLNSTPKGRLYVFTNQDKEVLAAYFADFEEIETFAFGDKKGEKYPPTLIDFLKKYNKRFLSQIRTDKRRIPLLIRHIKLFSKKDRGYTILTKIKPYSAEKWIYNSGKIKLEGKTYEFLRMVNKDGISRIAVLPFSSEGEIETASAQVIFLPDKSSGEIGVEDPRVVVIKDKGKEKIVMGYTALGRDGYWAGLAEISKEDFLNKRWDRWKRYSPLLPKKKIKGVFVWQSPEGGFILFGRDVPAGDRKIPSLGRVMHYSEEKESLSALIHSLQEGNNTLSHTFLSPPNDWSYGCPGAPLIKLGNGYYLNLFHCAQVRRVKMDVYAFKSRGKVYKIALGDGILAWEERGVWKESRDIRIQGRLKVEPINGDEDWSRVVYSIEGFDGGRSCLKVEVYWGRGNGEVRRILLDNEEVEFRKIEAEKEIDKFFYSLWISVLKWEGKGKGFRVVYQTDKPFLDAQKLPRFARYGQVPYIVYCTGAMLSEDKQRLIASIGIADREIWVIEKPLSSLLPVNLLQEVRRGEGDRKKAKERKKKQGVKQGGLVQRERKIRFFPRPKAIKIGQRISHLLSQMKREVLKKRFWKEDLWTFSEYPEKFKLVDGVRVAISVMIVFLTFLTQNPLWFALIFTLFWNLVPTVRSIISDKLPHYHFNLKHYFSRRYINPQKNSGVLLQNAIGLPVFALILSFVFYCLSPFSGWTWVLLNTFIMANIGQLYNSLWRTRRYESNKHKDVRRLEFVRSLILNFFSSYTVQFAPYAFLYLSPWYYLIIRKCLSEISHLLVDVYLNFRSYNLREDLSIATPFPCLKIYEQGEVRNIKLKEFFEKWRRRERPSGDLLNTIKGLRENVEKVFGPLSSPEELKKFVAILDKGREVYSLKEEEIDGIIEDLPDNKDLKLIYYKLLAHKRYKTKREIFALACFLTLPPQDIDFWERRLKPEMFSRQEPLSIVLDIEEAKKRGLDEHLLNKGIFVDKLTGVKIILYDRNKKWDGLRLLLKILKARTQMEIFNKVYQRLSREKEFGRKIVRFLSEWYRIKPPDEWSRKMYTLIDGWRQALMLEYLGRIASLDKNLVRRFREIYPFLSERQGFNSSHIHRFIFYSAVKDLFKKRINRYRRILNLEEILLEHIAQARLDANPWWAISEESRAKIEKLPVPSRISALIDLLLQPKVSLSVLALLLLIIGVYKQDMLLFSLPIMGMLTTSSFSKEGRKRTKEPSGERKAIIARIERGYRSRASLSKKIEYWEKRLFLSTDDLWRMV
ncbi:MAG: hypothetical protein DRP75_04460, partial [Candidatus Omnitrophota bacterium]